jgi:hypothetical protein
MWQEGEAQGEYGAVPDVIIALVFIPTEPVLEIQDSGLEKDFLQSHIPKFSTSLHNLHPA